MMEVVSKRRSNGGSRNVVAGSVWESRMKMDQVKGGIKVFNGDGDQNSEQVADNSSSNERNPSGIVKEQRRKTWNSEPVVDPILIRKTIIRSDDSSDEFLDSTNDDGFEENLRSDEKIPIPTRKSKMHSHKIAGDEINSKGDKDQLVVVKEEIKVSSNKKIKSIKPKKNLVLKEKINDQNPKTSIPLTSDAHKRETTVLNHPTLSPVKAEEQLQGLAETHNKYQSIADIVMWRDIKVSSFVFGIGNLILLSPVITKDINFSFIPAIWYVGLICIAATFLYKAILNREPINLDEANIIHTVGEEQAVCLVKVVLPWINKFILEIRHLLSGDPATTMKFAVSLFLLARLGSFITVWRVTVLGFVGAFSLPKFYSVYSRQLIEEGILWLSQCRNVWNSYTCTKVIVAAVFTLVWSSSSTVARVWEVFMLIVSVRYFQETLIQATDSERAMLEGESKTNESPITNEETGIESEWRALFS
ncbi:hypothetical protein MKW94_009819 [Papaver nudicaule]|uniref:Reticulon-like protein n=1 Tax=Papaver nudicaule TaxID=74823 RepID=A0AA41VIM4_PAPNU|nr:hypothetical protein [Papaver nudicaule]